VVHQPLALTPLAKSWEKNPKRAARFQFIAGGFELVNAFSELNDPYEQEKRFKEEGEKNRRGTKKAIPLTRTLLKRLCMECLRQQVSGSGLIDLWLYLLILQQ